jgi:hypothetical protein
VEGAKDAAAPLRYEMDALTVRVFTCERFGAREKGSLAGHGRRK